MKIESVEDNAICLSNKSKIEIKDCTDGHADFSLFELLYDFSELEFDYVQVRPVDGIGFYLDFSYIDGEDHLDSAVLLCYGTVSVSYNGNIYTVDCGD